MLNDIIKIEWQGHVGTTYRLTIDVKFIQPCCHNSFLLFSFFFKIGQTPASLCIFSFFSHDKYSTILTKTAKSVDGVIGTWTRGSMIVGADKSTELWRHLKLS